MTVIDINGQAGLDHAVTWTGFSRIFSWAKAPVAPLAANGQRPCLVRGVRPYLAGRGGSRSVYPWMQYNGGPGRVEGDTKTVASGGSAVLQDWFMLLGNGFYLSNANGQDNSFLIGFDISGGTYFGWNDYAGSFTFDSNGVIDSNAVLAGQLDYITAPTAARNLVATQAGVTDVLLAWDIPLSNGGAAVTGYKIEWSLSSTFASGVSSKTVGAVTSASVNGLATGSVWYFRIGAINVATTVASTTAPWSATANALLIATTGNIDSWTTFGALPAGVSAVTAEGLRRALVPAIAGSPNALLKENNVLTAPRTLAIDTYGAKRSVDGLAIGATYRLKMSAAFTGTIYADAPNIYQIGIVGHGYGDPLTLAIANTKYSFEPYEFVATATTHEIAVQLHEAVTRTTVGELERLAIWDIDLSQIPSDSPFRLQSIDYESSLLNHFDLACNSLGARWWVDAYGVTQFSAELGDASPLATFTDVRADGKLEYVGIGTSYDTRNVVNDLTVNQHGTTGDYSENYKENTSIATWGSRADSMDLSLYDDGAYTGSVQARALEVLEEHSTPEIIVTWIRWNAQEDPALASRLEIYANVDVEFEGTIQHSRILNIKHDIAATRWMITLQLAKKE